MSQRSRSAAITGKKIPMPKSFERAWSNAYKDGWREGSSAYATKVANFGPSLIVIYLSPFYRGIRGELSRRHRAAMTNPHTAEFRSDHKIGDIV